MTYVLFDASSPRSALGGRVQASGKVSCDAGKVTVISSPILVGCGAQMGFTNFSPEVTRAYAVLPPRRKNLSAQNWTGRPSGGSWSASDIPSSRLLSFL